MVMSKEMYAYRVKDPFVASPVYLQLLIRSQAAREMLEGMTTGTSNRTRLESAEQLLELPVPPLPSLSDQQEVADRFLDSVGSRRDAEKMQGEAEQAAHQAWWPEGRPQTPKMEQRVKTDADPEAALRVLLRTPSPRRRGRSE